MMLFGWKEMKPRNVFFATLANVPADLARQSDTIIFLSIESVLYVGPFKTIT